MIQTSTRRILSNDEIIAKYNAEQSRRAEYMAKHNALKTKMIAFHREFAGKCKELDEFLARA